jgi:hypothetical protein
MALLTLTEEYNKRSENYIYDVTDHMDKLRTYASQCSHVTELGIGNVGSTFAFIAGLPANVVSYDASPMEIKEVDRVELADLALANNVTFTFVEEDPMDVTIANTDLLFIHDATDASRLSQELSLHGNKASKFIIVPLFSVDNESFLTAIDNFVSANPSWEIAESIQQWCGLVVLSK